jgi:PKD repeat protein
LTAAPTSGILDQNGILRVTFEAEVYLPNPIAGYSWDFNGDGTPEITGTDSTIIAQYQYPGLYFPRVTVTDNQGNVYTETTVVNVLSREEMDALLRSKWEGMKAKLFNKDIPTALDYFLDFSKEVYQQAFNLIIDELPQIASNMQDIEMIFLSNNTAKYRINRVHDIDGIPQTITYYIYFSKDTDGFWKIDRF